MYYYGHRRRFLYHEIIRIWTYHGNPGRLYICVVANIIKTRIPVLASVETVVAAVVGLVAFGQGLSLMKVIGIALVLCSIAVMNMTEKTE